MTEPVGGAATPARDERWMRRALDLARQAGALGEVPVGAALVGAETPCGEGWNRPITECDPTAHAEIVALRAAALRVGNYRLIGTTLYVTLEPCPMCLGALVHARVQRVVFGATDPKSGAFGGVVDLSGSPAFNHCIEYTGGVLAQECGALLRAFFYARRRRRDSAGVAATPPFTGP